MGKLICKGSFCLVTSSLTTTKVKLVHYKFVLCLRIETDPANICKFALNYPSLVYFSAVAGTYLCLKYGVFRGFNLYVASI